jgi:hypothetical protein
MLKIIVELPLLTVSHLKLEGKGTSLIEKPTVRGIPYRLCLSLLLIHLIIFLTKLGPALPLVGYLCRPRVRSYPNYPLSLSGVLTQLLLLKIHLLSGLFPT